MIVMSTFGDLRNSDLIVCPADGQVERVLSVRRYARLSNGSRRVFVRTSRHDHVRDADDPVDERESY